MDEVNRNNIAHANEEDGFQDRAVCYAEGSPTDKKWYHGAIPTKIAENRLLLGANNNNGSYLVYDDPNQEKPGHFILIVYFNGEIMKWRISRSADGMYVLGGNAEANLQSARRYRTVRELIKEHRGLNGRPLRMLDGGSLTLSKSYVYIENEYI